jgi:copper chaperone
MTILKFKTNVKCDNCVAKITPFLNEIPNIEKWEVDLTIPDRMLTVEGENVKPQDIIEALSKAGYSAKTIII